MENLRNATLLFLIKKTEGKITDICLAMKKRGFGAGRYNGVGGKVEAGESIIEAAKREAEEEIGVKIHDLEKMAELCFYFPHNSSWNQMVHVYFSEHWENQPKESEEMNPAWFKVDKLPFKSMWSDDPFWLPLIVDGKLVKGRFTFGEKDTVMEKEVKTVDVFNQ